jgi:phosphoribosylformylglycinamidine (FGAM) synthase-like enzyme/phosphoribosylformylglycinamidine (FGAM) synthase PurS component
MIWVSYKKRRVDSGDPQASKLLAQLRQAGYEIDDLKLEQVLRVEGPEAESLARLMPIFWNGVVEVVDSNSMLSESAGPIREVSYQRAWTDPEMSSYIAAARSIGINDVSWVRLATRYQFLGVSEEIAEEITNRFFCNPQIQTIIRPGEVWDTLIPQGRVGSVEKIDVCNLSDEELVSLSNDRRWMMPLNQLQAVRQFYKEVAKRPARDAEVEMIAAAWSDHCSHTTWRALGLLQLLRRATESIKHHLVISAYVDNSGVMKFYSRKCLCAKGETHISPTFGGSPFGGIMTKLGGVIRDIIFTGQGAWTWAATTLMGICSPWLAWKQVPLGTFHPAVLLKEAIRGTHGYTNPMGIPMAWSEYRVDPRNVKGLALGHAFGVLPLSRAKKGKAQPGDFVVLIGEPTGDDGLHGATVSSSQMTSETSTVDAAHVQIGMPIGERVFMEVVPVLRDANCIRACTDCGAAGLSSAVGEMGESCGGVWVNLATVPLKCAAMLPWKIWLSESQERGVLAVPPKKIKEALRILADYGVPATVIGLFTNSSGCRVEYDSRHTDFEEWPMAAVSQLSDPSNVVVDLPYSFLGQECPLPTIEVEPWRPTEIVPAKIILPRQEEDWRALLVDHLGHFDISGQSSAAHQYDQTVQGNTVVPYIGGVKQNMPDDLFVATPVRGKPWGAGVSFALTQRWTDVNPGGAGEMLMAQALTKLVAAGFSPDDVTCTVNVYTPRVTDSPVNAGRLVHLVHGYAEASKVLKMPVISGKDSSSGTFTTKDGERIDAPLTCCVSGLGRIINAGRVIQKPFADSGDHILMFTPGTNNLALGGSVFASVHGLEDYLPSLDLGKYRQGLEDYYRLIKKVKSIQGIRSRSVVAEGGLIRRLFEMSIGSGLGCYLYLPDEFAVQQWLFSEFPSLVFTVPWRLSSNIKELLGDDCHHIGRVWDEPRIQVSSLDEQLFSLGTDDLASKWLNTFKEVV